MVVCVISWLAGAIRETQMSSLCKLDPSVPRYTSLHSLLQNEFCQSTKKGQIYFFC